MSILRNGYFRVSKSRNEQLQLVMKGANHETLNHAEQLPSWDEVKTNILATIRASNGKNAVVVDATKLNLEKKNLYYRISEAGVLKQVSPADQDDQNLDASHEADIAVNQKGLHKVAEVNAGAQAEKVGDNA